MAQDTEQLRDTEQMSATEEMRTRIDRQRDEIGRTVDQIGTRVSPSQILARRQDRMLRRLTSWKDAVFGNDEPDFPPPRGDRYRFPTQGSDAEAEEGVRDRVGDAASTATSALQHTPATVRRQTRGNPMAAGAIAVGVGWLMGGLLPESRSEKRAVRRVTPQLARAADEMKSEGRALVDDLRDPAQDALAQVKGAVGDAVEDVKGQAQDSAGSVRDHSNT